MDDDVGEEIDDIDLADDFDPNDIDEEEDISVEFEDDEIEDYRDLESRSIKFANQTLDIDLNDEHHCTLFIVPDNERTTSQIMTLEEYTEAVGIRATEIENGTPVFTDVSGMTCPIEMAKKEILDGKSPYKLIREMSAKKGSKTVEIWKINDMTLPITRRENRQITKNRISELGLGPTPVSPGFPQAKTPTETSTKNEKGKSPQMSPETPKTKTPEALPKTAAKKPAKKTATKKVPAKK